jgi:putative FmdB family regulatory protein
MPTYVYLCGTCGEEFSLIMGIREYESAKVACPKCKSEEVKQQITHFMTKTSRKLKLEKYVKR